MQTRLATLVACLALGLTACSDPAPDPADTDSAPVQAEPLRVGMEAAYPPFEEKTADGGIVGFDVDLVKALGASLGRPVELQDLPFDSLLLKLRSGDLDMVCSGLSFTEERARAVDFSKPYLKVPMGVLVGTGGRANIQGPGQLDADGVVVAVQRATTGETKARELFPHAEVRVFDTEVDAANELIVGRAHAFVYDLISVHKWHAKHTDKTRVLTQDLGSEEYCIALAKGSPLRAQVDAFLTDERKVGGVREAIEARWLPDPERFRVGR